MTAAMTNTGFVALPILHSIYGQPAVLPAALATVFVAAVMFPASVILLEGEGRGRHGSSARPLLLVRQIVLNPMVLSILVGLAWAIAGWPIPAPRKNIDHRLLFSLAAILILRDMRDFPLSTVRRALSQIFNALCETGDLCS
jgi:predicted permease